jgi:hypothetical protein
VPLRITRTKGFLKAYAKLASDVQDRVDIALRQFAANPRHPGCTSKNTKAFLPCASIRAAGASPFVISATAIINWSTLLATTGSTAGTRTSKT